MFEQVNTTSKNLFLLLVIGISIFTTIGACAKSYWLGNDDRPPYISRTSVSSGTASLIPFARIFKFVKSLRRNSVGLGHSSSEVESLIEEENWVGIYETTF